MDLFRVLLLCCLLNIAPFPVGASYDVYSFFMDDSPPWGLTYLGPAKYKTSTVTCARHCLHDYTGCTSFLFHSDTGLCTPGSTYNIQTPVPTPQEGHVYVIINYCNILNGLRLITFAGTTACVGNFMAAVTYDEADNLCQKRGGFLASAKTWDKLTLLKHLVRDSGTQRNTWVGCDDKVEEGTYVWKEDGENFTIANRPFPITISDDGTDENLVDCLYLPHDSIFLHDFICSANYFDYACEIALQSP